MDPSKSNSVHEIDVSFTSVDDIDALIKRMKTDPYISMTTSLKKFSKIPYEYDYWYSKSKQAMKISDKNGKIFDLTDKLLKTYDKVSDS